MKYLVVFSLVDGTDAGASDQGPADRTRSPGHWAALRESDIVVCTILDSIVRALRSGNKVEIRGFGTFNTRQRAGRTGRNPKTGARVEVPPKRISFFKASKEVREPVEKV